MANNTETWGIDYTFSGSEALIVEIDKAARTSMDNGQFITINQLPNYGLNLGDFPNYDEENDQCYLYIATAPTGDTNTHITRNPGLEKNPNGKFVYLIILLPSGSTENHKITKTSSQISPI